jgi:anion-transporting  ArsA/GET3 family ATPase
MRRARGFRHLAGLPLLISCLACGGAKSSTSPAAPTTPFAQSRRAMQEKYLHEIAQRFAVPVVQVPLLPHEVKGILLLIELGQRLYGDGQPIAGQVKEQVLA